eukprot:GFYU01002041.1.p1 GENE.GFYU01002041.1~~GFYU01002041.1.p1  ORF type:complete len:235 (-),score=80.15 GFYU01002041.1:60-716(-)
MTIDSKQIATLLKNKAYLADSLKELEPYVEQQIKAKTYDLDANLAVLKLYQFFPELVNMDILKKILLKSLCALPASDFNLCMYLIPEKTQQDEKVAQIAALAELLETANFPEFWKVVKTCRDVVDVVSDFDEHIRTFAAGIVQGTYQRIPTALFCEILNVDEKGVTALAKKPENKWTVDKELVTFPLSEDNQAKPKKTQQPMEFGRVTKVLQNITVAR